MESLVKTWESLSEEKQLLLKKCCLAGLALYILLLAVHDLMPYALVLLMTFYLYKFVSKKEVP